MAGGSCTDVKGKYRFQAYEYRDRRIPLVHGYQDKEGDLTINGLFFSLRLQECACGMSLIYRAGSLR